MTRQPTFFMLHRRGIKALAGAAVFALVATGFIGFLHTSAGRPLLARLGVGCPVKRVSPMQAEALRQRGVAAVRGATPAPVRPALGMRLDHSTEADVVAWAARNGVTCKAIALGLRQLQCHDVPAAAFSSMAPVASSPVDELMFAFNPAGRLISVDVLRTGLTPENAARLFARQTGALTTTLGTAPVQVGDPSPVYLRAGALRTVLATYRFADYLASVTAMTMQAGVAVREQYQSATPTRVQ
ncbi:MAG TPA: hypothetical protein VNO55_00470 [Polyangia bacterium]|nr:hypothetical protein [Polyangia bacterium]